MVEKITRVETVHLKNYIHRDIKTENFLIGLGKESSMIYLLDFGLAKKFRDSKTHQHIPYKENKSLTGTARYASINTHLGIEQSRRDDLEALGYVLVYLSKGRLPWQALNAKTKEKKHEKILNKKMGTPIAYLCDGLFPEYASYLQYCRALKFEDRPDYVYLKRLFTERMEREKMEFDLLYDWIDLECKRDPMTNKSNSKSLSKKQAEEYKRQPSLFRTSAAAANNDVIKEEEEDKLENKEIEEKKEEIIKTAEMIAKEESKKKIDEVFQKIRQIGHEDENAIKPTSIKDALNVIADNNKRKNKKKKKQQAKYFFTIKTKKGKQKQRKRQNKIKWILQKDA